MPPTLPTFQAVGTAASGTGNLSPAWPAHAVGDVALLVVDSQNEANVLGTPSGFVEIAASPQNDTGIGTPHARLSVFWCRATSTSMAAPTVTATALFRYARIYTFRNVATIGDPVHVSAGAGGSGTSPSIPGATTTIAGCLVVAVLGYGDLTNTAQASGWTNASLGSVTERGDESVIGGAGAALTTGTLAVAGTYSATTATLSDSIDFAGISLALRPVEPVWTTYTVVPIAVGAMTFAVRPAASTTPSIFPLGFTMPFAAAATGWAETDQRWGILGVMKRQSVQLGLVALSATASHPVLAIGALALTALNTATTPTQDTIDSLKFPSVASEWLGPFCGGFPIPNLLLPMQESASPLRDTVGGLSFSAAGANAAAVTYGVLSSGWGSTPGTSRKAVRFGETLDQTFASSDASLPDLSTTSFAVLIKAYPFTTWSSGAEEFFSVGASSAVKLAVKDVAGKGVIVGTINGTGAEDDATDQYLFDASGGEILILLVVNVTAATATVYTSRSKLALTYSAIASGKLIQFGSSSNAPLQLLGAAAWWGRSAEVSDGLAYSLMVAQGATPAWTPATLLAAADLRPTDLAISAAGTVTGGTVGTAAITLDALAISATGAVQVTGAEAATLAALAVTSAGAVAVAGAGATTLASLGISAAGAVLVACAAAVTLDPVAISSAGAVRVTGSEATTLADVTGAAAGVVAVAGSSAVALDTVAISAAGAVAIAGASATTLATLAIAADGAVGVAGDAAIALADLGISADGAVGSLAVGSAAIQLDDAAIVSAGAVRVGGDAAIVLDDVAVTSAAAVRVGGAAAVTLGAVTSAGAGAVAIAGAAGIQLADLGISAAGAVAVAGAAAVVLGDVAISADGSVGSTTIHGAGAIDLDVLAIAAAGGVRVTGSAAGALDAASVASAGAVALHAAAAVQLGAVGSVGAGTVAVACAAAITLDPVGLVALGHGPAVVGTLDSTLDDVTIAAAGAARIAGDAAIGLADLAISAAGAVRAAGTCLVTLGDVTSAAAGAVTIAGAAALQLADLQISASAGVAIAGAGDTTLDPVGLAASGFSEERRGSLDVTLAPLTGYAAGVVYLGHVPLCDVEVASAAMTVALAGAAATLPVASPAMVVTLPAASMVVVVESAGMTVPVATPVYSVELEDC